RLTFQDPSPEEMEQQLLQVAPDLSKAALKTAIRLTSDPAEAEQMCRDTWFAPARNIVIQLVDIIGSSPKKAFLFLDEQWHQHFSKKEELSDGLNLLLLYYQDMLYYALGYQEKIAFADQEEKLR